MVLFRDVKGQEVAVRYLSGMMESGRVSSSYLFHGPEGVGKALTAKAFIAELLCSEKKSFSGACGACRTCLKIDMFEHPDVKWKRPEKNKNIRIDEIREIKSSLSLKPFEAPFGVCVIEDAHMMTQEASNALLKMLEEPPGKTLIILLTGKKELLLDTVISRCAEVRFRSLPRDVAAGIISSIKTDLTEREAVFMAGISQGSPGRAVRMIEEGMLARREEIISTVEEINSGKPAAALNWGRDDKDGLLEDIETLLVVLRDLTLEKEETGELILNKDIPMTRLYDIFRECSIEKIFDIAEKILQVKAALSGNANPKIAAQVLPGILAGRIIS